MNYFAIVPIVMISVLIGCESFVPEHSHPLAEHTHADTGHTHPLEEHTHADTGHTHPLEEHTHADTGHTHPLEELLIRSKDIPMQIRVMPVLIRYTLN